MRAGKHWTERNKKGCARLDTCIAKQYAPKTPGGLPHSNLSAAPFLRTWNLLTFIAPRRAGKLPKSKQAALHARLGDAPPVFTWADALRVGSVRDNITNDLNGHLDGEGEGEEDEDEEDAAPPTVAEPGPGWLDDDDDEPPPPPPAAAGVVFV